MLSKTLVPKTKAELIAALQRAAFRNVDIFEGERLGVLPSATDLGRRRASAIVLW